jgi:tetratricopeptide (TPR) repeat protein
MAYWGEAMSHYRPVWHIENIAAAQAALTKLGASSQARLAKAPTERERAYLQATDALFDSAVEQSKRHAAFAEAMRTVAEQYNDVDAAVFYAFALIGQVAVGDYQDGRLDVAGAAAERAFKSNPKHPGAAHAVIHAYDDRVRAPRALDAARVYATLAMDSSHARHMPAHVFLQLGRWDDAARSDEAAWQAALSHGKRRGLRAGDLDYHPLSWLVYEYVQQGRLNAARGALKPLEDALVSDPRPWMRNELATWRAYYVIGSERWSEVATKQGFDNADELFALGYAAARTNDLDKARATLDVMKKVAATDKVPSRREVAVIMERQLAAITSAATGSLDVALAAAQQAASLEDKTPLSTGRPHPVKSSHELLGELLLQAGRPVDAVKAFEHALRRMPNRSRAVLGLARAAAKAGDTMKSGAAYKQFLANWRAADAGLAEVQEAKAVIK